MLDDNLVDEPFSSRFVIFIEKDGGELVAGARDALEAGLGFAVAFGKAGVFIGRDALLRQREAGLKRRLATFALDDPQRMLYHNEPIWRDGRLVGRTTSGMFGHTIGSSVAFGYVEDGDRLVDQEFLRSGSFEIEVAGERIPARCTLGALYDPKSERIRS